MFETRDVLSFLDTQINLGAVLIGLVGLWFGWRTVRGVWRVATFVPTLLFKSFPAIFVTAALLFVGGASSIGFGLGEVASVDKVRQKRATSTVWFTGKTLADMAAMTPSGNQEVVKEILQFAKEENESWRSKGDSRHAEPEINEPAGGSYRLGFLLITSGGGLVITGVATFLKQVA